jgi:hypothetical protein
MTRNTFSHCMCSEYLDKCNPAPDVEIKPMSTNSHDVIRCRLYVRAGLCCQLCEAFKLEQQRAHIDWEG